MLYVRSFTLVAAVIMQVSCTGVGGQSSPPFTSPGDYVSDPSTPTSPGVSPNAPTPITAVSAQDLVKQTQNDLASNPQYALTNQDIDDLSAEGLVFSDELKGWVK